MDFDDGASSPSDASMSSVEEQSTITINVHPTTGGQFQIEISPDETAEELRRKISRRLQTPKERLKVLHKEQILEEKPLKDYNIVDGSKITLLPAVESGFSSTVQGTQQSIIQAIESLSDPQIDDFLSGRLPLTLALRVGDHMMFVQLQLEQSQLSNQNSTSSRSHHAHPAASFSQPNHPLASTATCIPSRLFPDMRALGGIPAALAATALLPKSAAAAGFSSKKSPGRSPSTAISDSNITGPAPKVPKLALRAGSERRSGSHFSKEDPSATTGIVYKPEQFHHHTHSPSLSPETLAHPMFDPNLYHEIASHVNHHSQQSASHLHKLASACSSLGQVMAIPPSTGTQLNIPAVQDHHKVKSSRKRPSTLAPPDFESASSSSTSKASLIDVASSSPLPSPTAIIQNALLRQHQQHIAGFPPPSSNSMPSAYAKLKASSKSQDSTTASSAPSTPTSPPTEMRLRHPITSNMLQAFGHKPSGMGSCSSNGSKSESHHHHGHRRSSSTSGKITSSAISAHHSSGLSGARVARQMQRLRRLCASHQQCVAYSNRELATEISSIVHMAKHSHHHHHSRSEGSSHRKSHKSCRECRGRDRNPGSQSSGTSLKSNPTGSQSAPGNSGACIDSFTTHGPGIFSGTFSGSLHPSIQDHDGKPKRDPKTILQILTDLLNATQQYQGQLGNVGLLPQLFKDHFKGENATGEETNKSENTKPEVSAPKPDKVAAQNENIAQKKLPEKKSSEPEQSTSATSQTKQATHRSVYQKPYVFLPSFLKMPQNPQSQTKTSAALTSYLSSVSTIPIGNISSAYSVRDDHVTSSHSRSRKSSPSNGQESHGRHHHHHHSSRCHHHRHHHSNGGEKSCCSSSSSRRQSKSHMLNSAYVKRLKQLQNENANTRNKMKELKVMMETQRRRRQCRRNASKLYNRRNAVEAGENPVAQPHKEAGRTILSSDASGRSAAKREMNGGKMEVQFDDIQFDEIKEVNHEPAETVIV